MFTRHRLFKLLRRSPCHCCFQVGRIPVRRESPLPMLFLCWLGICVPLAYGGSRGADRKTMPYPDTPTPPELPEGLFWPGAPWRGLSSASRPCLGLLWDGGTGNSGPTRMYFARCGFELCLPLAVNLEPASGSTSSHYRNLNGRRKAARADSEWSRCTHCQWQLPPVVPRAGPVSVPVTVPPPRGPAPAGPGR
jgi:hypothetical protein